MNFLYLTIEQPEQSFNFLVQLTNNDSTKEKTYRIIPHRAFTLFVFGACSFSDCYFFVNCTQNHTITYNNPLLT